MTEKTEKTQFRIMRNKKDQKYWVQVREAYFASEFYQLPEFKMRFFGLFRMRGRWEGRNAVLWHV